MKALFGDFRCGSERYAVACNLQPGGERLQQPEAELPTAKKRRFLGRLLHTLFLLKTLCQP